MVKLDTEGQEQFLEQFSRSVKESGKCVGAHSIAMYDRHVDANLAKACVPRPWVMKLMILMYQRRLRKAERLLTAALIAPASDVSALAEQVERLRFAEHYGRTGNAKQRAHCLHLLRHYRVAPLDAPFLVWARAIGMSSETATFGHWDWFIGVCMMPWISLIFLSALAVALSPKPALELKLFYSSLYFLVGCGAFSFYKAVTVDLFRVGLRYFKPNGLSYKALPR